MKIKIVGIILIILGSIFYITNLICERHSLIIEKNKIEYTLSNQISYKYQEEKELYDAILFIPQINLKKGIYKIDDKRNNINENIMIDKNSTYPNQENSNVILVAHSGTGRKAFFNDILKLNTDSLIEFYYDHVKYVYKIDNYYYINKTGKASIIRDLDKKTITLITCSQKDKSKQIIYIGYLIDEIKY